LEIIAEWILIIKSSDQIVFADIGLTGARSIGELFEPSIRSNLAVMGDSTVLVLEPTVCHETNLLKSRQYKLDKYSNLGQKLVNSPSSETLEYFTLEVST